MKLTLLFFIIATLNAFSASRAQTVNLTLKNASVETAFTSIRKQTGYRFIYKESALKGTKRVNVDLKNEPLESALKILFKNQPLDFQLHEGTVIIKPKVTTMASASLAVESQQRSIKGKVTDEEGMPLVGVTVAIKGTSIATSTDENGAYELNISLGSETLVFSTIGYKSIEQSIGYRNQLDVILESETGDLDEVVVVGYGVQKKENLSGAVATVATKQLVNRPVTNIGQALQGAAANLNVNIGSGQAIESPSFNIRGTTSLNGGSPLIVIDGVIADGGQLNRMNPLDIESVSVLKDAASSAIYGSRAAYGVILVTTKSGRSEKLTINYNNNFSFRQVTRMPDLLTDQYEVAKIKNVMGAPWYHLFDDDELEYAKRISEDPEMSPYFLNPDGTYTYFGNTDWIAEAYKDVGYSTDHTVNLSGKTDRLGYYFSGSYAYNDGMIRYGGDTYDRYNLRSRLDFKINDRWTISNNTNVMKSAYGAPSNLSSGYYWSINRRSSMDVPKNPDGSWTPEGVSVLGLFEEGGDWKEYRTTLRTHFNSRFDLIKEVLFLQGNFSYTNNGNNRKWHYLPVEYYDGPERAPKYQSEVTSASADYMSSDQFQIDLYATYVQTFADKHSMTVMAGFNQEEFRSESRSLSRKDLISNSTPSLALATGEIDIEEGISTWTLRSGFGRLNYVFDDRYIFEFNARYDGTSRFQKDSRFTFNPSGSVAWLISNERFFEPLSNFVSLLKPRFSYGRLGNQEVSTYAYLATMESGKIGRILDGNQPMAVYAPGLVDGGLTWEKVSTINYGLDVNFLKDRLELSAEIYERRTRDMLTKGQTLPAVLGTSVPQANAADLKTKGWEVTAGWRSHFTLSGKASNINLRFNVSDSRSEITKFENPKGLLDDYYVGYRFGEVWGLNTLGFFESQEEIENHADQTPVTSYAGTRPIEPGDLKFEDKNGDGVVDRGAWTLEDSGDYGIIGNTSARLNYGFILDADWNGFDLSLFFQGVGKRDYFPGQSDVYFWGTYYDPWTNITMGNYLDHWTEEKPDAYFPRLKSYLSYVAGADAAIPQTRYKQNAAYLRLKNLSVGYTLPQRITQNNKIDRLRVFFSGDNLFVKTGLYKHFKVDPEILDGQRYPLQRSLSVGINVTF